jgi:hypothetical protein
LNYQFFNSLKYIFFIPQQKLNKYEKSTAKNLGFGPKGNEKSNCVHYSPHTRIPQAIFAKIDGILFDLVQ